MKDYSELSDEEIFARKQELKHAWEREYHLPDGAIDRVNGDIIRLFLWRDTHEDPGPLSIQQRQAFGAKYFNEIFAKKQAKGELIFRDEREAKSFLHDCGFEPTSSPSLYIKDYIEARIVQIGIVTRILAKNTETDEILYDKKGLGA